MGAALTYARRYALFTLVGIAGEDDLDAPDLALQGVDRGRKNGPQESGSNGVGVLPRIAHDVRHFGLAPTRAASAQEQFEILHHCRGIDQKRKVCALHNTQACCLKIAQIQTPQLCHRPPRYLYK
jgi:hypothetical protein